MAFGNSNVKTASEMKMSREERLKNRKASMTSRVIDTKTVDENLDSGKNENQSDKVDNGKNSVEIMKEQPKLLNGKTILDIEMDLIDLNEDNSKIFSMGNIDILAKTIQNEGFRGAIEIFKKEDGRYEIISGHRRFLAQKQLGKNTIPAIIEEMPDDVTKATMLLSSNINNRDLTSADRARMVTYYYNNVLLKEGWREKRKAEGKNTDRQEACAEFFGYSITNVKRYKALGDLEEGLQQFLSIEGFPYTAFDGLSKRTKEEQKKVRDGLINEIRKHIENDQEDIDKILSSIESFPLSHKDTLKVIKKSFQQKTEDEGRDKAVDIEREKKTQLTNLSKSSNNMYRLIDDIMEKYEVIDNDAISLNEIDELIQKLNELKEKIIR